MEESTEMKYYQDMTVTNAVWNKCDCKILIEEVDDDEVEEGENKGIVEEIRKRKRRYRKKRGKNDKKWRLDTKKFSYLCLNARKSVLLSPEGSIIAWREGKEKKLNSVNW